MKMFSVRNVVGLSLTVSMLIVLGGCKNPLRKDLLRQPQTTLDSSVAEAVEVAKIAPEVTIWIHGTTLTPKAVMPNFFHRKAGLNPAIIYEERYHLRKIANAFDTQDQELFPLEHFYIFGWNGKLNFEERKKAAQELCYELMNLHDFYREKYDIAPRIRIITHSHGGNVALNLAKVKEKNHDFVVSELIMLACPVQAETMHLVNDPLFKKVYSFYSESDLIQVIDPQGLYHNTVPANGLFSKRLFPQYPQVHQIKTKLGNRGLAHIEFLMIKFLRHMPTIMKEIAENHGDQNNFLSVSIQTKKIGAFHRHHASKIIVTDEWQQQSPKHQSA